MALVRGPYTVVGDPTLHDPLAYRKVTGTMDFPDDHVTPKKKWWLAIKGAPSGHGNIVIDVGTITGITVAAAGSGYTVAPTVTLTGGTGTTGFGGATATATVSGGAITAFTLTSPGQGYFTAPTVTVSTGSGATGTATVTNGSLTAIAITAGGSGYLVAPTIAISGGAGTGATATATISSGVVTGVTITAAGTGYTSVPTLTFTAVGTGGRGTVTFTAGKAHVDATAALAVPGVKAVYWFEDKVAGGNFSSSWTNYGAQIAGVVAEDLDTAEYATTLIKIDYNVLPVVGNVIQAMDPNSPLSGKSTGSNVVAGGSLSRPTTTAAIPYSDTAAFAVADKTIGPIATGWYRTMQHNPVQPKTALVYANGGEWYGYCCSQSTFGNTPSLQTALSSVSATARNIHEQKHTAGGGFGDAESVTQMQWAGRVSAALNGHPICLKLSRTGHNHLGSRQYETRADLTFGVKNDGTLVAAKGNFYGGGGGASGMWAGFQKTYRCPWISFTGYTVNYNAPGRGPWRCVSDEPGGQAYDIAMDVVANQLGMDAYDFRQKNIQGLLERDQDNGLIFSDKGVNTCLQTVHDASNYATKKHAAGKGPARADGKLHGIACAGRYDSHGGVSGSGRFGHILLGGDGIAKLYHGSGNASTGPQAAMMNITAEVMGLKASDVILVAWSDTDLTYTAGMENGSAHTGGAGTAYYNAALNLRNLVLAKACTTSPFSTITLASVTTKAKATANIANGSVVSFTITTPGAGYSAPPIVVVSGPTAATASGTAVVTNGVVTSVTIGSGGSGYSAAPSIDFLGGVGTGASATATITNGVVTAITVTAGGSGYTQVPIVALTGPTSSGYVTALAQSQIDATGAVTSIGLAPGVTPGTNIGSGITGIVGNLMPVGGLGYTSAPTVTIYDVTVNDLDAANSVIFLKADSTKTATYASVASSLASANGFIPSVAQGWGAYLKWAAVGDAPIGSACNTAGSMASCAEVLVDPETGDVQILGYWNAVEVGTTISKVSIDKEIGSGCEAAMGQALFYGDVYDPNTAAVIQMAHGCFHHPTSLDFDPTAFHLYDVQSFDPAGPLGCHGMSEPGSGAAMSIQCAIFNATGSTKLLDPKAGSCSSDIVLTSMGVI